MPPDIFVSLFSYSISAPLDDDSALVSLEFAAVTLTKLFGEERRQGPKQRSIDAKCILSFQVMVMYGKVMIVNLEFFLLLLFFSSSVFFKYKV